MFEYYGYGLHIESAVRLPGFVEKVRSQAAPDVVIRKASVSLGKQAEESCCGMTVVGGATDIMRFRVQGGKEIVVDPLPEADLDYLCSIVSGELMAALLRQRGLLALHASCVAKDGEAIGFVGYSGWGKSTLATHFVERGYRLMCDDVLAVDLSHERPMVVPGYPQVKLGDDSGRRVEENFETLPTAHSKTSKRLLAFEGDHFTDVQAPLRRLYLLEGRGRETNQTVAIESTRAFSELMGHTRASNLLKSSKFQVSLFNQITALLRSIPVKQLRRRKSLDLIAELGDVVEKDCW